MSVSQKNGQNEKNAWSQNKSCKKCTCKRVSIKTIWYQCLKKSIDFEIFRAKPSKDYETHRHAHAHAHTET